MTQTRSSTIDRQQEQKRTLRTQVGGSGSGGRSISTFTITEPDDNESHAAVVAAEAHLLRQRITHLLANVTNLRHEMNLRPSLREQRAHAIPDFDILEEGGAM